MNAGIIADLTPYSGCRSPFTLDLREPSPVGGIDREQLFQAVVYCEATEPYLYGRFSRDSPPVVQYPMGSRPVLERIVERVADTGMANAEKAVALGGYVYEHAPHPLLHDGELAPKNRGWTEEQLLEDGRAWCNEQARIFVCLCQIAGMAARMVAIFHSDRKTGHVVSEFWTGGNWALLDVTYNVMVESPPGRHISTADIRNWPPSRTRPTGSTAPQWPLSTTGFPRTSTMRIIPWRTNSIPAPARKNSPACRSGITTSVHSIDKELDADCGV